MSQTTLRRVMSLIGPLEIVIIILVLITAFVHLQRATMMMGVGGGAGRAGFSGRPPAGFAGRPPAGFAGRPAGAASGAAPAGARGGGSILSYIPIPLGTLFLLNFIGYIVLVVALYMPPLLRFQRITRWLLIAFAAVTIVAWFLIAGAHPTSTGYIDKVAEVALIILLVVEDWRAVHANREGRVRMG